MRLMEAQCRGGCTGEKRGHEQAGNNNTDNNSTSYEELYQLPWPNCLGPSCCYRSPPPNSLKKKLSSFKI